MASRRQELDEDFIKYLHYLMEAERHKLRGAGVPNPDREPSTWLMILEIVKKGVYHELAKPLKDDVSVSAWVLWGVDFGVWGVYSVGMCVYRGCGYAPSPCLAD